MELRIQWRFHVDSNSLEKAACVSFDESVFNEHPVHEHFRINSRTQYNALRNSFLEIGSKTAAKGRIVQEF